MSVFMTKVIFCDRELKSAPNLWSTEVIITKVLINTGVWHEQLCFYSCQTQIQWEGRATVSHDSLIKWSFWAFKGPSMSKAAVSDHIWRLNGWKNNKNIIGRSLKGKLSSLGKAYIFKIFFYSKFLHGRKMQKP